MPQVVSKEAIRMQFIDMLVHWEGGINTTDISEQFNLSSAQARTLLKHYRSKNANALKYSESRKRYIATPYFQPPEDISSVSQYLQWLQLGSLSRSGSNLVEPMPPLAINISPSVMRGLVEGARQKKRVEVNYFSLSNPNDEGRIICPHSFVDTGARWHVRAYCEKSASYRDFVLTRFRDETSVMNHAVHGISGDIGWNTSVEVCIQPDKRLSQAKRKVIEQDYQMTHGELKIKTRGCLVNYLLRSLQISTKTLDLNPQAQQLICANLDEIKSWLFEG